MRVLITSGLSEIPVLAAAYALCRREFEKGKPAPAFDVLCSEETAEEADRVFEALEKKLQKQRWQVPRWEKTKLSDAYDPAGISRAVAKLLATKPNEAWHLHYTGGTAAMAVQSLKQIQRATENWPEISYLSSEDHRLRGEDDVPISQIRDERREWNLTMEELVGLRGFEILRGSGRVPTEELIGFGCKMMDRLFDDDTREAFARWKKKEADPLFQQIYEKRNDRGWLRTNSIRLAWLSLSSVPGWDDLMKELWAYFFPTVSDPDLCKLEETRRRGLQSFLNYQCLELYAYRALKLALNDSESPPTDVRHSTEIKRKGGWSQKFELDVAAVCGYELLLVSCGMTARDEPKQKAFEAAFRARQVGGSHVWPVMLSMADPKFTKDTQDALVDHVGGPRKTLQVWGKEDCLNLERLKNKFIEQLEKMQWTA